MTCFVHLTVTKRFIMTIVVPSFYCRYYCWCACLVLTCVSLNVLVFIWKFIQRTIHSINQHYRFTFISVEKIKNIAQSSTPLSIQAKLLGIWITNICQTYARSIQTDRIFIVTFCTLIHSDASFAYIFQGYLLSLWEIVRMPVPLEHPSRICWYC